MRMIETIAANICCMLPAAHGEGTFIIPILYIKRWAPGLWVGGKSTRKHLKRSTAGGQGQGLACYWRHPVQLGRGPAQAAVKWLPALLQAEP